MSCNPLGPETKTPAVKQGSTLCCNLLFNRIQWPSTQCRQSSMHRSNGQRLRCSFTAWDVVPPEQTKLLLTQLLVCRGGCSMKHCSWRAWRKVSFCQVSGDQELCLRPELTTHQNASKYMTKTRPCKMSKQKKYSAGHLHVRTWHLSGIEVIIENILWACRFDTALQTPRSFPHFHGKAFGWLPPRVFNRWVPRIQVLKVGNPGLCKTQPQRKSGNSVVTAFFFAEENLNRDIQRH